MKLGKFFFELDTNVVYGREAKKDEAIAYYFQRKDDYELRLNEIVEQHGIEAIQAVGEYQ